MWVALFIALSMWLVNQFGCSHSRFLFVGHVIWHICIGYVAVYLMQLGLLNDGMFQFKDKTSKFWLSMEVVERGALKCNLDTSDLFNPAYRAGYQQLCLQLI